MSDWNLVDNFGGIHLLTFHEKNYIISMDIFHAIKASPVEFNIMQIF